MMNLLRRKKKDNPYKQIGYENRTDFLVVLSKEYSVPFPIVEDLARIYGDDPKDDKLFMGVVEHIGIVKAYIDSTKNKT